MMKALFGVVVPRRKSPDVELESRDEEAIRRRAYELYLLRGRVDGYAVKDGLQAEDELTQKDVAA